MPLLHEKVVKAMSHSSGIARAAGHLHPITRIASAIHPVINLIVEAVAGEIGSPPMTAAVGSSEMPTDVSAGLPSARASVRTYADRLDGQIEAIHLAWQAWLNQKIAQGKALTDDQIKFDVEWPAFYSDWKRFFLSIQSFSILGPSPSEAWAKVQSFDDQTETFRQRLASYVPGTTVVVPSAATDLGNQPSVLKDVGAAVSSTAKTLVVGGLVVGGGVLLLSLWPRLHSTGTTR